MKVLEIPFNQHIGLEKANGNENYLLKLPQKEVLSNHLETVHAGAMFSLAEASSGEFLLKIFEETSANVIPVVRKAEVKYSKPANGDLFSKAVLVDTEKETVLEELNTRKRSLAKVKVDIFDANNQRVMTSVFDWFFTVANI